MFESSDVVYLVLMIIVPLIVIFLISLVLFLLNYRSPKKRWEDENRKLRQQLGKLWRERNSLRTDLDKLSEHTASAIKELRERTTE